MRLFAIYHPVLREIPRKTGLFLCFHGFFRLFSFPGLFWTLHVFQQLSIYEDSIALENRGSGMESLIKTQIALDRANGLDVILMEEPENHLSFSNLRKMLQQISDQQENSQIIVATHNNMIASRLNLNNVLWITEDGVKSLNGVKSAPFPVK